METMSAKDAKNHFGALLDAARRHPVTIEKNGRPVTVMISVEEYRAFVQAEDDYWGELAEAASKEGYIGPEASQALIQRILNADD